MARRGRSGSSGPRSRRPEPATRERGAERPDPDGPQDAQPDRPRVGDGDLEDLEPDGSTDRVRRMRTGGPILRRPLRGGRVMLDEEGCFVRPERAGRRQPPANDLPVGADALTRPRVGQSRTIGPQASEVAVEIIGGNGPGGQTATPVERLDRRCADPGSLRRRAIEHSDQLEVRIPEPDQPVERPERLVTSATLGPQPDPVLELTRPPPRDRGTR